MSSNINEVTSAQNAYKQTKTKNAPKKHLSGK